MKRRILTALVMAPGAVFTILLPLAESSREQARRAA